MIRRPKYIRAESIDRLDNHGRNWKHKDELDVMSLIVELYVQKEWFQTNGFNIANKTPIYRSESESRARSYKI